MRGHGGRAAAPADEQRGVLVQPVVAHHRLGHGPHLLGARVQELRRGRGDIGAESGGQWGDRGLRHRRVAPGEVPLRHPAQRVRRTGHGDREAAPGGVEHRVVGRVVRHRTDHGDLRVAQIVLGRETGVRQPRDVRAARTDADDLAAVDADHRSAAHPDGPHVERREIRRPAEHGGVPDGDLAPPHDADVRGGAAGLQEQPLADALLHQRAERRPPPVRTAPSAAVCAASRPATSPRRRSASPSAVRSRPPW